MTDEIMQNEPEKKSAPWGIRILKTVARIILVLLVGAVLGAAAYFGLAFLYNETVVSNRAAATRLDQVATVQAGKVSQLEDQLGKAENRVSALENQQTSDRETNSALQGRLDGFQKTVEQLNSSFSLMETRQADLDQLTAKDHTAINDLARVITAPDSPLVILRHDVQVIKAQELLNRARSNFIRSNYGLAGDDMNSARAILSELQTTAPAEIKPTLGTWISRLDMAISNLQASPVLAFDDLEIAWGMMSGGVYNNPTATATPAVSATLTDLTATPATVTPAPAVTATVTPTR
jgi:TolA-binding protein